MSFFLPLVVDGALAGMVYALVALALHPPAGGWSGLRWQFIVGILLAAVGGCLVTLYKPAAPAPRPSATHLSSIEPANVQ